MPLPARQEASGQIKAEDQSPCPLPGFFNLENEGSFSNHFTMECVLGKPSVPVQLQHSRKDSPGFLLLSLSKYLFNKYIESVGHVPGTLLGSQGTTVKPSKPLASGADRLLDVQDERPGIDGCVVYPDPMHQSALEKPLVMV